MRYRKQGMQADFLSACVNKYEETGLEPRGEAGTIFLDRAGLELHPEEGCGGKPEIMILDPNIPRGSGSDGKVDGLSLHLTNRLDCIRTRCRPNAPIAAALIAASTGHWANITLCEERLVKPTG